MQKHTPTETAKSPPMSVQTMRTAILMHTLSQKIKKMEKNWKK